MNFPNDILQLAPKKFKLELGLAIGLGWGTIFLGGNCLRNLPNKRELQHIGRNH